MARIKICGLRREQDIAYVNALKPDYIGFILSDGFRRSITGQQAEQLRAKLSPDITAVGVFVDADAEYINSFVDGGIIDMVQLHGSEAPDFCTRIKAPVIKALKPCDFDKINAYAPYADYFLFDSGTGSGKTFDWSAVPEAPKPFFLAGGINEANIKKAIEMLSPYCIDLSSAVETDGFKDYDKIKKIMECVR